MIAGMRPIFIGVFGSRAEGFYGGLAVLRAGCPIAANQDMEESQDGPQTAFPFTRWW